MGFLEVFGSYDIGFCLWYVMESCTVGQVEWLS